MNDRIRVNGVLYESVIPRRGFKNTEKRGQFNQISYSTNNSGAVCLAIISTKESNKRYYDKPFIELTWSKKFDSSFISLGNLSDDYDDIYVRDDMSVSEFNRIYEYIVNYDSKLSRPWTSRDADRVFDYITRHYHYIFIDEFLEDMDQTWDEAREYWEDSYNDAMSDVVYGHESPDIFFDYYPDYDEMMQEIQADQEDLVALRAEDNRRIAASLR